VYQILALLRAIPRGFSYALIRGEMPFGNIREAVSENISGKPSSTTEYHLKYLQYTLTAPFRAAEETQIFA